MRKPPLVHKLATTQGLSLLEIMVAIAVATIAMTALVVIGNTAISGVDTSRGRATADQFVREGIEQMRAYRDSVGYGVMTSGLSATKMYFSLDADGVPQAQTHVGADPCAIVAASGTTYQIPNQPTYYRIIAQTLENGGSQDRIEATVCFQARSDWQSASAETILTNWR